MKPDEDLFSTALIRSYVSDPHFVERSWLKAQVETALAASDCRFLLLNAEPGAGKTAFVAWLASQHGDWPRYFIRRNSQEPLNSGNDRAFLLATGHQLAAVHPDYEPERLAIVVRQRVGEVQAGGSVVGIAIQDLYVSPFYRTAQQMEVDQEVSKVGGPVTGVAIARAVTNERLLERGNLQYLALLDPARALAFDNPTARIVVLVDAIDELRDTVGQATILTWLAECPELPPNVRVVLTTRLGYDAQLAEFRQKQGPWLRELTIDPRSDDVQADVRRYAARLAAEKAVSGAVAELWPDPDGFVSEVVHKADGNLQFVAALSRAIEEAAATKDDEHLCGLLLLKELPRDLQGLYAFFLTKIRAKVSPELIEVRGAGSYTRKSYLSAWEGLYQPILGTLSVAHEPLTAAQLGQFVEAPIADNYLQGAIGRLGQFLDEDHGAYRLYHSTFSEFLTAPDTKLTHPECFIDPVEAHQRIAIAYRGDAASWADVHWDTVDDYGLRHLAAHLYMLGSSKGFDHELFAMISPALMRQKRLRFGSHHSFSEDVSLLIALGRSRTPPDLVQLARGSVLRATLGALSTQLPPSLVGLLASIGQVDAARDAALLIQDPRQRMDAHLCIVRALGDQRQPKPSRLDASCVVAAAREHVWITLGQRELSNNEMAEMYLEPARVLADAGALDVLIQPHRNNPNMLSILAELLSRTPARDVAVVVARRALTESQAERPGSQVDTLCWAAQALAQAGQHDEAIRVAEQALPLGVTVDDKTTPAWVVPAFAAAGRFERALELASGIPDAEARARAQHIVVRALIHSGDPSQARAVADSVEWAETHADALASLAAGFAGANRLDDALTTLPRINYAAPYADALGAIVNAQCATGRIDDALATAERIETAANLQQRWRQITLPDTPPDVQILPTKMVLLSNISIGLARKGKRDRAATLANEAIKLMPKEADAVKWSRALAAVARALIEAGALESARDVMQSLVDQDEFAALLPEIMKALARNGAVDEGLALAHSIAEVRPQTTALAKLAGTLTEMGQVERANAVAESAVQGVWRAFALGAVAETLLRQGNHDAALAMVDRATRAAEILDDRGPAIDALCAVGEVLVQQDAKQRALAVAAWADAQRSKLTFTKPYVEATTSVAALLQRAGEPQGGTSVINEVFKVPIDPDIQVSTLLRMRMHVAAERRLAWTCSSSALRCRRSGGSRIVTRATPRSPKRLRRWPAPDR
jgi:tetratricopeptide (TPR) repeat protein